MLSGALVTQAVATAAALGLGDALADEAGSSAEVAERCGADPEGVHRLLGALATLGIVERLNADFFCLTDLGQLLRSDHPRSLRSWAVVQGQLMAPLLAGLLPAVTTGGSAAPGVFGCSFYEHLAVNPELDAHWNRAMAETALSWFEDDDLLGGVDWPNVSRVVDVGAGLGATLAVLLRRCPHLGGVVYDLANVVGGAPAFLESAGVGERVEVVGGSFFDSVPQGGDVYLLVRVLFNWPDDDALAILKACRRAMTHGARLLVIDHVLGEEAGSDAARLNDLNLLVMGGRARTLAGWNGLVDDAGLKLVGHPGYSSLGRPWAALVLEVR